MKPAYWLPAVLILGLLAALSAGQDAKAAKPQVIEEFDVAHDGDALCVPVTLQGKKYLFLVDTGASHNVFDLSLPLGKPQREVKVGTPQGPLPVRIYESPDASLGKLNLRSDEGTLFSA
jgi:Aspartyl protease